MFFFTNFGECQCNPDHRHCETGPECPSSVTFLHLAEKVKLLLGILDSGNHDDFSAHIIGDDGTQKPHGVDLFIGLAVESEKLNRIFGS